jgi:DNA-binding MarR family transcriptional regulator
VLDDQIGYKLRLANQRHLDIFSRQMPELTPTQFSILVRLHEVGELSQNHLGRLVAMDAATTKGVIERLVKKGLLETRPSTTDRRRVQVSLTGEGERTIQPAIEKGKSITEKTLERLSHQERDRLLELLGKVQG